MAALHCPRYELDWDTMRAAVNGHIKSQNHGYVAELQEKDIEYINAYASFVDR